VIGSSVVEALIFGGVKYNSVTRYI